VKNLIKRINYPVLLGLLLFPIGWVFFIFFGKLLLSLLPTLSSGSVSLWILTIFLLGICIYCGRSLALFALILFIALKFIWFTITGNLKIRESVQLLIMGFAVAAGAALLTIIANG